MYIYVSIYIFCAQKDLVMNHSINNKSPNNSREMNNSRTVGLFRTKET